MRPTYSPAENVTPQETGFHADKTCHLLRQALPVDECRRLIATVTAAGFRPMGVDYPPGYRNNDRAVLDDAELAAALFDRLRPYLPERVTGPDGATWRLSGLNERFRFCRYADGQSFCIHRDGAWSRRAGERSLLTCMTYLNGAEEFSGGATRYYVDQDPRAGVLGAVSPAAGTMVVFDHDLWHDGEAVIRGVKYVMRTDVMYVREGARELAKSRAGRSTELRGHEGYVWSVLARRDGRLVSASRDRTIRHRSPASGGWREVACWSGHEASVLALAEDNAGRLWSASRDRTVRVWDGCLSEVVGEHDGAGLTLAALPDGCVASGGADGNVQVWSTTRDTSTVLRGHRGWVWALTPLKAHLLASGGDDGQVRLWNPGTGECLAALPLGHGSVRALAALAPDLLVSGHENGTVAIWRVASAAIGRKRASS